MSGDSLGALVAGCGATTVEVAGVSVGGLGLGYTASASSLVPERSTTMISSASGEVAFGALADKSRRKNTRASTRA
jgi:hypothetical protein